MKKLITTLAICTTISIAGTALANTAITSSPAWQTTTATNATQTTFYPKIASLPFVPSTEISGEAAKGDTPVVTTLNSSLLKGGCGLMLGFQAGNCAIHMYDSKTGGNDLADVIVAYPSGTLVTINAHEGFNVAYTKYPNGQIETVSITQ